jgi:hypothetical protein
MILLLFSSRFKISFIPFKMLPTKVRRRLDRKKKTRGHSQLMRTTRRPVPKATEKSRDVIPPVQVLSTRVPADDPLVTVTVSTSVPTTSAGPDLFESRVTFGSDSVTQRHLDVVMNQIRRKNEKRFRRPIPISQETSVIQVVFILLCIYGLSFSFFVFSRM